MARRDKRQRKGKRTKRQRQGFTVRIYAGAWPTQRAGMASALAHGEAILMLEEHSFEDEHAAFTFGETELNKPGGIFHQLDPQQLGRWAYGNTRLPYGTLAHDWESMTGATAVYTVTLVVIKEPWDDSCLDEFDALNQTVSRNNDRIKNALNMCVVARKYNHPDYDTAQDTEGYVQWWNDTRDAYPEFNLPECIPADAAERYALTDRLDRYARQCEERCDAASDSLRALHQTPPPNL